MATTSVGFIFQNKASSLDAAAFTAIPYVAAVEDQSANSLSGRERGGGAYNGSSAIVSNNIARIDAMMSNLALAGYAKNGCFHVTTSGTTGVTIDLTNLATNSTTTAGDVTFAKWNLLIFYNLSGVDGVTAASMTIAPGASNPIGSLFGGTSPTLALAASSRVAVENTTGVTVSSSAKTLLITPTAGGNFALCVGGS
jgi:hypothetical protein